MAGEHFERPEPDDVEGTACYLSTFLSGFKRSDRYAVVELMTKMIPICCDSEERRQHDAPD